MTDGKNKIEALLFSSGRKMPIEELSKLTRTSSEEVVQSLNQLREDYEKRDTALHVYEEGGEWKLTIKEKYASIVRRIVTDTELTKSLMETLAVIASKTPVLQSQVIKIRTNKAYEHLSELEKTGFIKRTKYGRTKKIGLTEKFFNYFDLSPEDSKKKFNVEEPVLQKSKVEDQVGLTEEKKEQTNKTRNDS